MKGKKYVWDYPILKTAKKFLLWVADLQPIFLLRNKFYLNDKRFIEKRFKKKFGYIPDLENPRTFNEKNNWRKLYDRKDIYTKIVDKYLFKEYVKEKVGESYTFPLLGVWDDARDIDFDKLPEAYVLKVNHAGGVVVCRNNKTFNRQKAIRYLNHEKKRSFYIRSREWPYKNVQRKIICEKYMGENLIDYKNYCFNGKTYYTFVWQNMSREDGRKPDPTFCGAYDRNWDKSEIEIGYPSADIMVDKPEVYDEMIRIAEKLSESIPFVRVDCYIINNHVYVGEMTFFPWGGFMKFKNPEIDKKLGDLECIEGKKGEQL